MENLVGTKIKFKGLSKGFRGSPLEGLTSPGTIAAIFLLALNDHILKGSGFPSFLTGKLSDFAGLYFFPFLLCAIWNLILSFWNRFAKNSSLPLWDVGLSQGKVLTMILLTGFLFAGVKASTAVNDFFVSLLGKLLAGHYRFVQDPTDLIALFVLPLVYSNAKKALSRRGVGRKAIYRLIEAPLTQVLEYGTLVIALFFTLASGHSGGPCRSSVHESTRSVATNGAGYLVGIGQKVIDSHCNRTGFNVGAQQVSSSGDRVGSLILTGHIGSAPLVALDETNYLLAWVDDAECCNGDLMGQFVNPAGGFVGSPFVIHAKTARSTSPDGLFFDGSNYFVIWQDKRRSTDPNLNAGPFDIFGQRVSPSGALVGEEIQISIAEGTNASVAFDGTNYLVVWTEDNETDVKGRFVSLSGALVGPEFFIDADDFRSNHTSIAFDGANYLAVWSDEIAENEVDLFGRLVSRSGGLASDVIPISTDPGPQSFPFVASDGTRYLVAWTDLKSDMNRKGFCNDNEGTCWDIIGQRMSKSGALAGSQFPINTNPNNQLAVSLLFDGGKYFLVWNNNVVGTADGSLEAFDSVGWTFISPSVP